MYYILLKHKFRLLHGCVEWENGWLIHPQIYRNLDLIFILVWWSFGVSRLTTNSITETNFNGDDILRIESFWFCTREWLFVYYILKRLPVWLSVLQRQNVVGGMRMLLKIQFPLYHFSITGGRNVKICLFISLV